MNILTIDPGSQGGIAWRIDNGPIRAAKMPEDPIAEIRRIHQETPLDKIGIERQSMWASGKGDDDRARAMRMQKLIASTNQMIGAIKALGIPIEEIASISWQSKLGLRIKGDMRSKADKKKSFQRFAQTQAPNLKVTLNTADAICMLVYVGTGQAPGKQKNTQEKINF